MLRNRVIFLHTFSLEETKERPAQRSKLPYSTATSKMRRTAGDLSFSPHSSIERAKGIASSWSYRSDCGSKLIHSPLCKVRSGHPKQRCGVHPARYEIARLIPCFLFTLASPPLTIAPTVHATFVGATIAAAPPIQVLTQSRRFTARLSSF